MTEIHITIILISTSGIWFFSHILSKGSHDLDQPTVFICHTTKGKGVSFMENSVLWHYRCPKGEDFESALKELKSKNIQLIDESPRIGTEGFKIAFIHPKATDGILIELCQKP